MDYEGLSKQDYNNEPVLFCERCLSLNIKYIGYENLGYDYCDLCGSADIEKTSIEEWEKLYKERYGHTFITK